MTINVEKTPESTWTGIAEKLDTIVFMGWPSLPTNITVKSGDNEVYLGVDQYAYIQETKKLTVLHEFDMNLDYIVNFE